jgi:hypothetical protein
MLAMARPAVLPSVTCHGVGTPVAIISQLNTLPACAPVNASMAALRLATHDSGSGWLAMPFLCDSFIHYSTPVLSRRTARAASTCGTNHRLMKARF